MYAKLQKIASGRLLIENLQERTTSSLWSKHLMKRKRWIKYALDLVVLAIAFALSYLFRFDFAIPRDEFLCGMVQIPWVVMIQFATLNLTGAHQFIWRYVGMTEAKSLLHAAGYSLLLIVMLHLGLPDQYRLLKPPRSVIVMDTVLALGGILTLRLLRRTLYERNRKRRNMRCHVSERKRKVLLIGAGRTGMMAAREIFDQGDTDLEVEGFLDDDPTKQGSVIEGVRVLGSIRDLPRLAPVLGIDHVIVTITEKPRPDIDQIIKICERVPIKVRIIPGLDEILQGKVEISRIRDLKIEDVLGRPQVHLDQEGVSRFLTNRRVMITGAGGSIGSELARQVIRFHPSNLLLVERAEFVLFNIDRELRESWPGRPISPVLADVNDRPRMQFIFDVYHPDVILHAAAHKHVPMMEFNASEAIKNNVLATHLLGELAGKSRAEAFVLISTDKAVRPTSVMGASKRVAELVVQDLNKRFATRYVAVRFGNVIGSVGSVIPIFCEQIRKGGPVTVTHPEMKRYFMSIPEAAQLVLQAGMMGEGGEIFILDMGDPVSILQLAESLISLSGLKPYHDIDIVFTGVRPGEKLFEELAIKEECLAKTRHPKIFIGKIASYPERKMRQILDQLTVLSKSRNDQELRSFLNQLLPDARLNTSPGTIPQIAKRHPYQRAMAARST